MDREVIGTMLEEVDRLSRLADELLTLSRAEAGQANLRMEPVDLCAVGAEVVDRLSENSVTVLDSQKLPVATRVVVRESAKEAS